MANDLFSSLSSFIAIVENQGFTAASRKVHISTSTLTKHIQWLESHLNKKLLHRTTRYIELTEEGKIYHTHAKKIIYEVQSAKEALMGLEKELHGPISIGIPTLLLSNFFSKKFKYFLEKYPKISFQLSSEANPIAILESKVDIVLNTVNLIDSKLIKKTLFHCEKGIFAAPSYLEKYGLPKTISELENHNCLNHKILNPTHTWEFKTKKVKVRSNYQSDSGLELFYAGVEGLGLFTTIKLFVEQELRANRLIEIKLEEELPMQTIYLYHLPYHRGDKLSTLTDYLLSETAKCR